MISSRIRTREATTVGAVLLLLAGCSSQPDVSASPGTPGVRTVQGAVVVFAAASLTDSFEDLADGFEAMHPAVDVTFNFGGSSALAAGIVLGAPVDVFAAASRETMQVVTDAELGSGEPAVFGRNELRIAVPPGNPAGITGLLDFADPARTIALCSPDVPCGAAAAHAIAAAGIVAAPDTLEEDVRAALTKVELGEVDAALVYRTDILAAGDRVDGIDFTEAPESSTDYLVARLSSAPNPEAATAFIDYVLGEDGQAILADAGFQKAA